MNDRPDELEEDEAEEAAAESAESTDDTEIHGAAGGSIEGAESLTGVVRPIEKT